MKQLFYAAKCKKDEIRIVSSSGGMFLSIANYFINKNAVVYGAIYNNDFEVMHIRANNMNDVYNMTGSKYAKSNINGIFKEIEKDLKSDITVLFTGTPCQIYALNKFLKTDYENLYTVDVVCHGTPEPKYLADYIKYQEKKYNSEVNYINMRYKDEKEYNKNLKTKHIPIGKVEPHIMMIEFKNNKKYISKSGYDVFYQLFDLFISKGCFNCPFSNLNRVSDITIGDFHEFSSKLGDFNDGNGISLLIINSKKGEMILNNIKDDLIIEEKRMEDCIQPAISSPAKKPVNKDVFDNEYDSYGFEYIVKKYGRSGLKYEIRKKLDKIGILNKLILLRRRIK